jgi:hypothetical protein
MNLLLVNFRVGEKMAEKHVILNTRGGDYLCMLSSKVVPLYYLQGYDIV